MASDGVKRDEFGVCVSISNGNVIVGASGEDSRGEDAGAAYIYTMVHETTGIDDPSSRIPDQYRLENVYPNPFNPQTNIRFTIPKSSKVVISVFDLHGKRVENIFNGLKQTGYHSLVWNAANFPAGTYFIRMQTEDYIKIQKCVLIK